MSGIVNSLMKAFLIFSICAGLATAGSYLIIIDASGSMDEYLESGQTKIAAAKSAAKSFIDKSGSNQIAIMRFSYCNDDGDPLSGDIRVTQEFTTDKDDLKDAVDDIVTGGDTPIAEAIVEGREYIKDELGSG
ncbi:hypothetical protein DRN67_04070, partial [Candidatus Micrarchaeota archaeon]